MNITLKNIYMTLRKKEKKREKVDKRKKMACIHMTLPISYKKA